MRAIETSSLLTLVRSFVPSSIATRFLQTLGAQIWREARTELVRGLRHIGLHAPKRSFEIREPWTEKCFNLMPIDQKLRRPDYPTICNYLRVTLCNVHDETTKRMDAHALVETLHGISDAGRWVSDVDGPRHQRYPSLLARHGTGAG